MEKNVKTTNAETTAQTNETVLRNINTGKVVGTIDKPTKVIAQTSKEAKALLKEKAKAEKKPAIKKEPKITLASKLDAILVKGGKWDALVAKANEFSKELGATTKFNVGTLKGHIKYRTDRHPDYLGNLKLTEVGITI